MKPMDFSYRKDPSRDKGLPNLRKWGKFEHGLKRTKRIYLHENESDVISRSLSLSLTKEQPVGLPGIAAKPKRKTKGTICIHNSKVLRETSSSVTVLDSGTASSSSLNYLNSGRETGREIGVKAAGGESPLSGNSSSVTESGSWTSGNASTSPRRRIRAQTPIVSPTSSSSGNKSSEQSKHSSPLYRNPHPPSKPRDNCKNSQSQKRDKVLFGSDETCKGGDVDEEKIPVRPKTPALVKPRHFKATLQNIQEICPPQVSIISNRSNDSKMKTDPTRSSRRRSVGSLANIHDVDDDHDRSPLQLRYGRRRSMPIDMHELKKQIDSIRYINIREFSREYIQDILSRRDKQATKGIAGDERRQNKCLSWLQSLEGAL